MVGLINRARVVNGDVWLSGCVSDDADCFHEADTHGRSQGEGSGGPFPQIHHFKKFKRINAEMYKQTTQFSRIF